MLFKLNKTSYAGVFKDADYNCEIRIKKNGVSKVA